MTLRLQKKDGVYYFLLTKNQQKILPGALDEGAGSDFFFSTFLFLGDDPAYWKLGIRVNCSLLKDYKIIDKRYQC